MQEELSRIAMIRTETRNRPDTNIAILPFVTNVCIESTSTQASQLRGNSVLSSCPLLDARWPLCPLENPFFLSILGTGEDHELGDF
jgi:hypothetical protein